MDDDTTEMNGSKHFDTGQNNLRGWWLAIAAAIGLALVSWASNISPASQYEGNADAALTIRYTISKLANSGVAWAGLMILSGWLVRRLIPAAVAGILISLLSLVVHYCVGLVSGMFDATIWAENREWFIAAAIFGGPLGVVGAVARRWSIWGLLARIVVPMGALAEPFVLGMFTPSPLRIAPDRYASLASGVILLAAGVVGLALVLLRAIRKPPTISQATS